MFLTSLYRGLRTALFACSLAFPLSALAEQSVPLAGHLPPIVASSQRLQRVTSSEKVPLALVLPLRNSDQLNDLLHRLYTPGDMLYGRYLTPDQFAQQFSPTQADYDRVIAFAQAQGFTVTGLHPNRTVVDVVANAQAVERAFSVQLDRYQAASGRTFRAPSRDPQIPVQMVGRLAAIVGMDTAAVWQTHSVEKQPAAQAFAAGGSGGVQPNQTGSGPGAGLTPADIKTAYNLNGIGSNGAGQSLALFELDGYKAGDITAYESYYGLPNVPLQNVLVDGYSGAAGTGAGEVTLDIELQIAVAPGASKIYVYEGPNSSAGVVDTYNRIATDNLAKSVSTSWGLAENSNSSSTRNSENQAFQQMAAQGQSIFAASGDSGAYDNGSTLSVDDPASQPYMTGVGGTALATNGAGGSWKSETTWNGGSISNGGGGGGVSTVWAKPSYQAGFGASTTFRNVPDVALDADPNTGYSIYYSGAWRIYGGTSCAAPLWSGFVACVNQARVAAGKSTLGFANTLIYQLGASASYASDFHDIADNSTNLYYAATPGYDNATGWGTINGAGLFADLVNGAAGSTGGTGGGGGTTSSQLLGNPGFENGGNSALWSATSGVIDSSTGEPAHSGSWKAWLNGYGTAHTDTLSQTVAVPSTITTATLTFWLHIDSAETTATAANDTLKVQVRNASGTVLATLATYSNLNKATGFSQKSFNLAAYKGQTVQIYLVGVENGSRQTSFVVDDFALTVQ
jgi:subtilase family serine protease